MLYRNRKRAFYGVAVKIYYDHALDSAGGEQVSNQPRAHRLAAMSAAVLPSVAKIGNDSG